MIAIILTAIILVIVHSTFYSDKSENSDLQKNATILNGKETQWAKSVIGKGVSIKDNFLWIDSENVNVPISSKDVDINGKKVTDCYTDKKGNLIVRVSNQKEIVIGKVNCKIDSEVKRFVVRFYDDKTLLKEEKIRDGENAISPNPPEKRGYSFQKWDKQFNDVKSDLNVYAVYKKETSGTEVYIENVEVQEGKEVETSVKVKNNPGILGMIIQLNYDENHLELIQAENGESVKKYLTLTKGKKNVSGCKFVWDGVQLPDEKSKDGKILSLKFRTKNVKKGDRYEIGLKIKNGDIVNQKLLPVEFTVSNGYVHIATEKR